MSDSADAVAFVPHKPDPDLRGAILYVVRLDYFGKLSKRDQDRLIELNPQANKKASVFHVGQTVLLARQRFENHLNGCKASRWVRKYGKWRPHQLASRNLAKRSARRSLDG